MAQPQLSSASPLNLVLPLRLGVILGALALWQLLGWSGLVYPGVLPSWLAIAAALVDLLVSARFWIDLAYSAAEIAVALVLGSTVGICLGLVLALTGGVGRSLQRYVHYLASTPKAVFLPVIFMLFGIGAASKIALGAFASSFPLALGTASAMRGLPAVYGQVAKSFDLSLWQKVRLVFLPAMLEPIVTGLRISLGIAFSSCLMAEMKFSNTGLGSLIIHSYDRSRFAEVYALLVVVVGLAMAATTLLHRISRRLSRRGSVASYSLTPAGMATPGV